MENILTVFSILVTVLIGWQIFNVINWLREKREISKQISDFEERTEKRITSFEKAERYLAHLMESEAIKIISSLSEIKEITAEIKKRYGDIRGVRYMVDKIENDYYYISVYEDAETHYTIIARYKVNVNTQEVWEYDVLNGDYRITKENVPKK